MQIEATRRYETDNTQLFYTFFYKKVTLDKNNILFRFDNIRLELDDVNECFELVKNMVMDSPAEPYFLSILQHLVTIRDDAQIR